MQAQGARLNLAGDFNLFLPGRHKRRSPFPGHRLFDKTTAYLSELAQPGAPLFGIQQSGWVIVFGGGVPVMIGGEIVGAVGASAETVEQTFRSPTRRSRQSLP